MLTSDIDLIRSNHTSKKLIMRHCFVRGLSSISENSETTDVDENDMDKWSNRYQSALPPPAPINIVESTITSPTNAEETPPFYEGKRPRYRLIHINWNFPKRLKGSKAKDAGNEELNKDAHEVSRRSLTNTINCPMTSSTRAQTSRKTTHSWTFSRKKKNINQPVSSSMNINGNSRRKSNADDSKAHALFANERLQKVLAQITAMKKKMKYKKAIIDQLSSERWNNSSFKVGWRPYPCYCDYSESPMIMLAPTLSEDSDSTDEP